MAKTIIVKGSREHNLKNISVEIPKDSLVVITGPSGSGKSSLALDTIYAEGQRRYVESLSAYARQFLELMEKPDVDSITGLSPAIAIEQKTISKNPRSTVGTATEVYDYLRLLFARIGHPYCYSCGKEIRSQSTQEVVDQLLCIEPRKRMMILAPIVRGKKGEYKRELEALRREGFVRVRIDNQTYDLEETIELDKNKKHNISVVVDRIVTGEVEERRYFDAIETSFKLSKGLVLVDIIGRGEDIFSENYACPDCGISYPEISPRLFSFNDPYGACENCGGLGSKMSVDPALIVTNQDLSLKEGALPLIFTLAEGMLWEKIVQLSKQLKFSLNIPLKDLPENILDILLYGEHKTGYLNNAGYKGIIPYIKKQITTLPAVLDDEGLSNYMAYMPCPVCNGKKLKKEALFIKVGNKNIAEVTSLSIQKAIDWLLMLDLSKIESNISNRIIKELMLRLTCLNNLGLGYLTIERPSRTLSGGEGQRIRLASQIGSGLTGVLYVLDEPSIGLHQRDNEKLLKTLQNLRNIGNTILVVEHDRDTIERADYIIDLGPGAGENGGYLVYNGIPKNLVQCRESITSDYIAYRKKIPIPTKRREGNGKKLVLRGVRKNNLKNVTLEIPIGVLTCVTGVSGSGKSTLIVDVLLYMLKQCFFFKRIIPNKHVTQIAGADDIDRVIAIDQSPIGRTSRSNPSTYTGLFTYIRELFSALPESRSRGFKPSRFSFNVKGGRCEACKGEGLKRIEMHFLPDIYISCEICMGLRFNKDTLNIRYKRKNIADILNLTANEAYKFFEHVPAIKRKLATLIDVGMGYVRLGQSATTLSGGEAQRLKLSKELTKRGTGNTLYIFDEPTTGLHFCDIDRLLKVIRRLVDQGNTAIVIEHNMDIIKCADHIVDLGPEGGNDGGYIIAQGSPEYITTKTDSATGMFLKKVLEREGRVVSIL